MTAVKQSRRRAFGGHLLAAPPSIGKSRRPNEDAPCHERDQKPESLSELRDEIDRIDGEMHELLIERGGIIDKLIAVKARQGGGSAFRPGREADMMRVIASRHHGRLPLDTVESIWRVIISTFTYRPVALFCSRRHVGRRRGHARLARFHFGFTVPLLSHATPGGNDRGRGADRRGPTAAATSA